MLTLARIEEVLRLLDQGELSQRAIALKTGVSRGTVGSLANGQRPLVGKVPEENDARIGSIVRCPTCGGRVIWPCIYCRTIAFMNEFTNQKNRVSRHNPQSLGVVSSPDRRAA